MGVKTIYETGEPENKVKQTKELIDIKKKIGLNNLNKYKQIIYKGDTLNKEGTVYGYIDYNGDEVNIKGTLSGMVYPVEPDSVKITLGNKDINDTIIFEGDFLDYRVLHKKMLVFYKNGAMFAADIDSNFLVPLYEIDSNSEVIEYDT